MCFKKVKEIKYFFSIRVFFTDTDNSQDSRGREATIFYSILLHPPAHKHWDIYLQLRMWDDYHIFLIAQHLYLPDCYSMRFTTLSNYHWSDWLMMQCLFVYLMKTGGIKLASTITLVLQANQLTKCASHPWVTLLLVTPKSPYHTQLFKTVGMQKELETILSWEDDVHQIYAKADHCLTRT